MKCFLRLGTLVLVLIASPSSSRLLAFPINDPEDYSSSLLQSALEAEANGDLLARQRLLSEAALEDSGSDAVKWATGLIQDDEGKWQEIADAVAVGKSDPKIAEYESKRAGLADTLDNQLSLARWCSKSGLDLQASAHLNRVLLFEEDHQVARRMLGFVWSGERWVSATERSELQEQQENTRLAIERYGRQLREIRSGLTSADPTNVILAQKELQELDSEDAIPAVLSELNWTHPKVSEAVIEWLSRLQTIDATEGLSTYAVFYPVEQRRREAAEELAKRPLHEFVPQLLESMTTEISTQLIPVYTANGALSGYRHAFAAEEFDKQRINVFDREFQRTLPNGRRPIQATGFDNADRDIRNIAMRETQQRERARRSQNALIRQRNERIADLLSVVAEREFTAEPAAMWAWWDSENENRSQLGKPQRYRRSVSRSRYFEQPVLPLGQTSESPFSPGQGECFAADTPVLTKRGFRPIERIVPGDLVLACNVDSGELRWQPVLRATSRPPEETKVIDIDGNQVRCTHGHLFWKSGKGWAKASELEAGEVVHCAEEPCVIMAIDDAPAIATYNLEVAEFNTYFVNDELLLTHDVTPRRGSVAKVPGLVSKR